MASTQNNFRTGRSCVGKEAGDAGESCLTILAWPPNATSVPVPFSAAHSAAGIRAPRCVRISPRCAIGAGIVWDAVARGIERCRCICLSAWFPQAHGPTVASAVRSVHAGLPEEHCRSKVRRRVQFVRFREQYPPVKERNRYTRWLWRSLAYLAVWRFRASAQW